MSDSSASETNTPTVRVLDEDERMAFLPRLFGPTLMIIGEYAVYDVMGKLSTDYRGGFWMFKEVSNGALYMSPDTTGDMTVQWDGNGYDGIMSPDAAGLVATLFALSHLSCDYRTDGLADAYCLLADFAASHAEAGAIFGAID